MRKKWFTKSELVVTAIILSSLVLLGVILTKAARIHGSLAPYYSSLHIVHRAMEQYVSDYGEYPRPEKWCDLLLDQNKPGMRADILFCGAAGDPLYYDTTDPNDEPNFPVGAESRKEYNMWNGTRHYTYQLKWSHYALNPNAEPNGPADIVLLFSTKGGWNQFGGPEILNTQNYLRDGLRGCLILFNDGRVKWLAAKNIGKLNWGTAEKEKSAK